MIKTPVNISKVPHRSLFRFPGGKTWLVPFVRDWLQHRNQKPRVFCEPFLGGGIVGLTVAFEDLAEEVVLVERDPDIAAVWKVLLSDEAEWLEEKIGRFELKESTARYWKNKRKLSLKERAFRTLLLNRINRAGIITDSAGMLKKGENGQGLSSRWYPQTFQSRIRALAQQREKIQFSQGDAFSYLEDLKQEEDVCFFLDPPYTAGGQKEGSRLYTYSEIDHRRLFRIAGSLKGDFLLTYSDSPEVRELIAENKLWFYQKTMKTSHHNLKRELIISKSLDWLSSEYGFVDHLGLIWHNLSNRITMYRLR